MLVKMEKEIKRTVDMLQQGKVILYPTDTIWGIGCDATQPKAVQRVFKIKSRPENKSAIILLDSVEHLSKYVKKVPEAAYDIYDQYPGPLTIVFDGAQNLPKNVIAKDGTIAIRVVKGDFCVEIIRRLGKPVISTSANLAGEPSPVTFSEVSPVIKERVDYVVDIYQDVIRSVKPSTIIKMEVNNSFVILRD